MTGLRRLSSALKTDILFQFKHGLYYIYLFITVVYIIILGFFKVETVQYLLPVAIFLDPSVLGMFFVGGIYLLEKEQGALMQVFVTPLRTAEYLLSKVLSLGLVSLFATVLITVTAYQSPVHWGMLFSGVLLTSVLFTLAGLLTARHAKSVNDYMVRMVPFAAVAELLCLVLIPNPWISEGMTTAVTLFPSVSGLNIILGAFWGMDLIPLGICMLSLLICDTLLMLYTARIFSVHIISED